MLKYLNARALYSKPCEQAVLTSVESLGLRSYDRHSTYLWADVRAIVINELAVTNIKYILLHIYFVLRAVL